MMLKPANENASLHDHLYGNIWVKICLYFLFFLHLFALKLERFAADTDASEEIPHYVIAKATYWRQSAAPPVRYPKISTTQALQESGNNNGRFVQWCSTLLHQRNPDRTAGRDRSVGFLDGKLWCCMTCLEINSGKSCASAPLQLPRRSDLNLLCQSGWDEFSRSSNSDKKRACARIKTQERESYVQADVSVTMRALLSPRAHTGVSGVTGDAWAEYVP